MSDDAKADYGRACHVISIVKGSISTNELKELVQKANAHFHRLTPSEQLRHLYEQKRSFARGMCPTARDYSEYAKEVDKAMPPAEGLTDTQIGLVLIGRKDLIQR